MRVASDRNCRAESKNMQPVAKVYCWIWSMWRCPHQIHSFIVKMICTDNHVVCLLAATFLHSKDDERPTFFPVIFKRWNELFPLFTQPSQDRLRSYFSLFSALTSPISIFMVHTNSTYEFILTLSLISSLLSSVLQSLSFFFIFLLPVFLCSLHRLTLHPLSSTNQVHFLTSFLTATD